MKKIITLVVALFVSFPLYANCGNDNGKGNGCSGNDDGGGNTTNVTNVTNTSNNTSQTTVAGRAYTDLAADVAVRLADSKYLQLQAYDTYVFGSHPGQDVFGQGFNQVIGARIVIKLGSSYEENLIEKQGREIKALEAALLRLQ